MTGDNPNIGKPGVEPRYFCVGLVLLAASLVAFAWGFSKGDLTDSQRELLRFLLPLCSGFCAGSFVGSLTVTSKGYLPGICATATGGFGVWLISVYFLFPDRPPPLVDFPPLPALHDKPEDQGMQVLTDVDRKKQEYLKTTIRLVNNSDKTIRLGLRYIASGPAIENADADRTKAMILGPLLPGGSLKLERERFGGPAYVWIATTPKYAWAKVGWRDLMVVSNRLLTISETSTGLSCDVQ